MFVGVARASKLSFRRYDKLAAQLGSAGRQTGREFMPYIVLGIRRYLDLEAVVVPE